MVYAAFIDWERARDVLPVPTTPARAPWRHAPLAVAVGAVLAAVLWHETDWARDVLDLGDRIDFRTIFFPILPASVIGAGLALRDLLTASDDA